ncbi:cysteine synthase family protein [candidate division WOR-3 bacterium]|nr:cysteine synthase family protein [candidate division WOR-3 bacterium]
MNIRDSIADCVGNTPLVFLRKPGPGGAAIAAKLEMLNPYSVKDRPVLWMLREAERRGQVRKGTTVIEASSGNTAIALASLCATRGYRLIICMSEIQSIERRKMLAALGAELVLTPAKEGTRGARERAKQLRDEIADSYYICQHSNPDNPAAHVATTAEELWRDTDGGIDAFVCGLGTTGTAMGVARVIKPRKAGFRVVGVEPEEAPILSCGKWAPHRMMGTAPGWVPDVYDPSLVDEIMTVSEEQAFAGCRQLAREHGILAGITSGATFVAALRLADRKEFEGKLVVCMLADSGERYLSVQGLY